MTEKKHTPGPWTYSHQDPWAGKAIILNADKMPSGRNARVLTQIGSVNMTIDEGEANVRLIASAPDLLAERDRLREVLQRMSQNGCRMFNDSATDADKAHCDCYACVAGRVLREFSDDR